MIEQEKYKSDDSQVSSLHLLNWAAGAGTTLTNNTTETTAPDGTNTACKYVPDNGTTNWISIYDTGNVINVVQGQQYTLSVYAKPTNSDFTIFMLRADVRDGVGINGSVDFDLSGPGSVVAEFGSPDASSIEYIGGGWYRCTMTCTSDATTVEEPGFQSRNNGDGVKGFMRGDTK